MGLQPEQIGIRLGRPAGSRELQVRDDIPAGAHEGLEQPEFRRGESQGDVADPRHVAAGFNDEIPGRQWSAAVTTGGGRAIDPSQQLSAERDVATRRMTALIRASSSALPNGFVR